MARRIKEERIVHQNRIAEKAGRLFSEKGISHTSMDEIAQSAGYSKATLYVYFKNKEEIVSFLALRSMSKLKDVLVDALDGEKHSKDAFLSMCMALVDYQKEYPDFFDRTLTYIRIDTNDEDHSLLNQTYRVGEEITRTIAKYLEAGIRKGEFRGCDNYFVTIFHIWGMISGLIKLAKEKEEYIQLAGKISKEQFLRDGFEKIYGIIGRTGE